VDGANGVGRQRQDARCLSALAMTLLRLGDEDRGLEAMRRAWKLDPYDARTYNVLNLFEKIIPTRYTTLATAHLRFRVEPARVRPSRRSSRRSSRATYVRYVTRYGFEPKGPVTFELYGDPRHFAVRTVGLPASASPACASGASSPRSRRRTTPSTGAWSSRTSSRTSSRSSCRARACRAGSPRALGGRDDARAPRVGAS
jgi:hypothetical protein